MEGSDRGIFLQGAVEIYGEHQSRQSVSGTRFEPGISRIWSANLLKKNSEIP